MDQFKALLRPLWFKLLCERVINVGLSASAMGMAYVAALIFISKFRYVEYLPTWAAAGMLSVIGLGLVYALSTRPTIRKAAAGADALGYKERFISAWELLESGQASPVSSLVIHDAMDKANTAALHKKYKLKIHHGRLVCAAGMLSIVLLVGFTPAFRQEEIERLRSLKEMIEVEAVKLEEAADNAMQDLSELEKKQLQTTVKQLLADLKKAKTEGEAIQAVQKSQEELKRLSQQSVAKDLKALGESLAAHPVTEALGENLKNGKMDEIADGLEQLANFLQNASEEDLEALSQILAEVAETLADNPELAQALRQASEIIASGQYENIQNAISKLNDTLSTAASQNAGLREAVDKLNTAAAQAGQGIRQSQAGNAGDHSGESLGEKQAASEGTSESQGSENRQPASGVQAGNQPGDQAGGPANGQTGESKQPGGSGRGSGHIDSETIYRREAQTYADSELKIDGREADGPDTQQEIRTMGDVGESVPYSRVVGQYRDEALKAIDDSEIPYGMKELVRDYFSSLD